MKFWEAASTIEEVAGREHLEAVAAQEIAEDNLALAKMALDHRATDEALGRMVRNSIYMILAEEADWQQDQQSLEVNRESLIDWAIDAMRANHG